MGLHAARLEAANATDESARRGEELATALSRCAALQVRGGSREGGHNVV